MCQDCGHVSCTDHPQAKFSITLSSDEKDSEIQRAELQRQIRTRNYSGNAWTDKRELDLRSPPSDPMDWEPTTPETGLVAEYHTSTRADSESSTQINPYIDHVSYIDDYVVYPDTDRAGELMRRVYTDLFSIMQREGWTVRHLTEFYPFEDRLRGLNYGNGKTILLRLRDAKDKAVFLPFKEIMWTAIHEVCHNRFDLHDGDFYDLWDELNTWHGIPGGRALSYKERYPARPLPFDHVGLLSQGKKIFLRNAELQDHFSTYANTRDFKVKFIQLPKEFSTDVVVRLVQLAKGLDPADERPLREISNARDYWDTDHDCFAVYDRFETAHTSATVAVQLYMHMYMTGEECGWHCSSREWVLQQFRRALLWDSRFQNGGNWSQPQTPTCNAATSCLVGTVRLIYQATTVQHQPLRDVVVAALKEVDRLCVPKGPFCYDSSMLNQMLDSIPELKADMERV